MRILFFLICCCSGLLSRSQVQFWNIADIEDEAWAKPIKDSKVKQVSLYRTDEQGKKLDASQADEVKQYNSNGQLVARSRYKYSWTSKKWELLAVDSFIYNSAGKLSAYRGFEGPTMTPTAQTLIVYNNKQQQSRQNHYTYDYGQPEAEGYDLFTYDTKGMPAKYITYGKDKKATDNRSFSFNENGKLIKSVTTSAFGSTTYTYTWNAKGQLLGSQEFSGKDLQKTITYTYDGNGNRIGKETTTTYNYDEQVVYNYDAGKSIVSNMYLQYPGNGGKNDRRHEYTMMEYVYY